MEAKAQARFVHVTPQKTCHVVSVIRGKRALDAVDVLQFVPQGAAEPVRKLVESAITNAQYLADQASERFDAENLYIQAICVGEGPAMKRIQPCVQGRANRILKRTSHITVVVGDEIAAWKKGRTR